MVGTVKARANHYEVLGLKPTATSDEIARAFAAEIGRPRALGGIAEISVAYETLRDSDRRRAYDDSLRPAPPKPEPGRSPSSLWEGSPYLLRASAHPAEPHVDPRPRPETPEPEGVSSIGSALRELARPEPLRHADPTPAPQAQVSDRAEAGAEPKADPPPSLEPKVQLMLDDGPGDVEQGPIPWKRTAIAAGALVLGVAAIGAWAGSGSGGATEPKDAVKLALPPSTTFTIADPAAAAPAAAPVVEDARALQSKRSAQAAPRVARARPTSRLAELERQISALPQTEPSAPQAAATDPAADAAPATAVAANMPLPSRVVASTIHRIGYPCGQVASSVPGGAPGVFTVTCTSGHRYQAAPVHGRYRFRRVAGR